MLLHFLATYWLRIGPGSPSLAVEASQLGLKVLKATVKVCQGHPNRGPYNTLVRAHAFLQPVTFASKKATKHPEAAVS